MKNKFENEKRLEESEYWYESEESEVSIESEESDEGETSPFMTQPTLTPANRKKLMEKLVVNDGLPNFIKRKTTLCSNDEVTPHRKYMMNGGVSVFNNAA